MKIFLRYILRQLIFWLCFFALTRLLFMLCQVAFGQHELNWRCVFSFIVGFRMDLSMSFYVLTPIFIILLINHIFKSQIAEKIINVYNLVLIILFSIFIAVDCELYQDWGYRIDYTPFNYLTVPGEAANFLTGKMILVFVLSLIISILIGLILRFLILKNEKIQYSLSSLGILIFFMAVWIIPIRGGLGEFPLNPGQMYYSKDIFLNHLAINPVWNMIYTSVQKNKIKSNFNFMDDGLAQSKFDKLINSNVIADKKYFKTDSPNILICILETFTAEVNHKNYKDKEIMPRLNQLVQDGIYFPNAYGCGDRTDKGVVSVLSGYPAQPQSSIMLYQKKSESLPSIIKSLQQKNYSSTFYYGGELNFASMRSYILSAGFNEIIDKNNFDPSSYNAKWGVHDHILFEKVVSDLKQAKEPFVNCVLSLSSHPPYDVPMKNEWEGNDEETKFVNSIHYADRSLGAMLDSIKKMPLWDNLVVILVGDHGGRFPGSMALYDPKKFHITMHITGGAVKNDSTIMRLSSQSDLAKTILNQLNISTKEYKFNQDLLSTTYNPFVYYAYNPGVGSIDTSGRMVFSLESKSIIQNEAHSTTTEDDLKAYLQILMKDFNNR